MKNDNQNNQTSPHFLIIGGNGKTGRRVYQRLLGKGLKVKSASRSGEVPFDWNQRDTWEPALSGVDRLYLTYHPDLAVPQAQDDVATLVEIAREQGVQHIVLLSGRGEEAARRCEDIVRDSGLTWNIARASWFNQNFSENFLHGSVLSGVLALPVGDTREPFIDADDIADVVVASLLREAPENEIFELTGPELLSFTQVTDIISSVTGQPMRFQNIPHDDFVQELREQQLPPHMIDLLSFLMGEVLNGKNAYLTDGVQRAIGREPKRFEDFVKEAHLSKAWKFDQTLTVA